VLFGLAAAGRDALPWPVALVAALGIAAATTLAVYALVKQQGTDEARDGVADDEDRGDPRLQKKDRE
jgi:hypothetical protein